MQQTGQGPAPDRTTLTATVLTGHPVVPDAENLLAGVRRLLPGSRVLQSTPEMILIAHEDLTHVFTAADGTRREVPLATTVGTGSWSPEGAARVDTSQSWSFPGAAGAVGRATGAVLVSEFMGAVHRPSTRVRAFQAVLSAVVETTRTAGVEVPAVLSHSGDSVVSPDQALGQTLATVMNVRAARVSEDVVLAETLGLDVLGLPDLAVRTGVDASASSMNALTEVAAWLVERGDVIRDGAVVKVLPDEPWTVQRTRGGAPERDILVFNA